MAGEGMADLDAMVAKLRGLRDFELEVAKEAAPLVQKAARASAAAGTTPEGKPWPPKKDGKGRPLEGSPGHITATARGAAVEVMLSGPDVFHHFGGRVPQRKVIPTSGDPVPASYAAAFREASRRVLQRRMAR